MTIFHQKVMIFLQKCSLFLRIDNSTTSSSSTTFSLLNMIYALLSKICRESHSCTCMGQIAQDAWIGVGRGAQPNLGNACILGSSGPATHPLSWSITDPAATFSDYIYLGGSRVQITRLYLRKLDHRPLIFDYLTRLD